MIKRSVVFFLSALLVMSTGVYGFASSGFSEAEKMQLHAQYVEIAEEISKETGTPITVLPIDKFNSSDWKSPDDFRAQVTSIANSKFAFNSFQSPDAVSFDTKNTRAAQRVTKNTTVNQDSSSITIGITGSFTTNLQPEIGRQVFESASNITSFKVRGTGSWDHYSDEWSLMDSSRTCVVTVSGVYTVAGVMFVKTASAEFYCSAAGVIE